MTARESNAELVQKLQRKQPSKPGSYITNFNQSLTDLIDDLVIIDPTDCIYPDSRCLLPELSLWCDVMLVAIDDLNDHGGHQMVRQRTI